MTKKDLLRCNRCTHTDYEDIGVFRIAVPTELGKGEHICLCLVCLMDFGQWLDELPRRNNG